MTDAASGPAGVADGRPGGWAVGWERMRQARARISLLASLLCGVLALGLPYGSWYLPGYYIPGWYVPEMCVLVGPVGDQVLDCTPGYLAAPIFGPSAGGLQPGSETSWRVFLPVLVALTVLTMRAGSRRLARAALGIGAFGVVIGGLGPMPGAWCAAAAVVLLAVACQRLGLIRLPRPGRRPAPQSASR